MMLLPWYTVVFCCLVVNGFSPLKKLSRKGYYHFFYAESSEGDRTVAESIASVYQNYEDSKNCKQLILDLQELKSKGLIQIWAQNAQTLQDPMILSEDTFLQQTKSLKTRNIIQHLREEIYRPNQDLFNYSALSVIACFVIWFGFIAGNKAISQEAKNIIGIFVLSYPFLISGVGIVAPSVLPNLIEQGFRSFRRSDSLLHEDDRIKYHEAGHFLLAYLLGIPITSYQLTNNIGISLSTEFSSINIQEKSVPTSSDHQIIDQVKREDLGKLLVISFGGIITEKLIYGNIKGGIEDFSLALRLVRRYIESSPFLKEQGADLNVVVEGTLLWSILQAEFLINQNYKLLETIVTCFRRRDSLSDIIAQIEFECVYTT